MSHSVEICRHLIRNSRKDCGQCTRSNKFNGSFGKKEEKTLCRYFRPLKHLYKLGLNLTYR